MQGPLIELNIDLTPEERTNHLWSKVYWQIMEPMKRELNNHKHMEYIKDFLVKQIAPKKGDLLKAIRREYEKRLLEGIRIQNARQKGNFGGNLKVAEVQEILRQEKKKAKRRNLYNLKNEMIILQKQVEESQMSFERIKEKIKYKKPETIQDYNSAYVKADGSPIISNI